MSTSTAAGPSYSPTMGGIYIANLIIGAGALNLPYAYAHAGIVLAVIMQIVLAFVSFVTVTFVIESMANANAIHHFKLSYAPLNDSSEDSGSETTLSPRISNSKGQRRHRKSSFRHGFSGVLDPKDSPIRQLRKPSCDSICNENDVTDAEDLKEPHAFDSGRVATNWDSNGISDMFELRERIEMGHMAKMFFGRKARITFYLSIILYLYGDLAIYAVAIPKSLTKVTCPGDASLRSCFGPFNSYNLYYLYVAITAVFLGPLCFFNLQKTKYLQVLTSILRYTSFLSMILIALIGIFYLEISHTPTKPTQIFGDITGLPNLFGVGLYGLMCHHSLPSLVTPISHKKYLNIILIVDFVVILVFYLTLCLTCIFYFGDAISDIITLNFNTLPIFYGTFGQKFFKYFLGLFPVFTLSSSFPIIANTLIQNIRTLLHRPGRPYSFFIDRIVFPFVAVCPPFLVAFCTDNVEVLAGITGSYAGLMIQYVIPAWLLYTSRKMLAKAYGGDLPENKHATPFRHNFWLYLIGIWSVICVCVVTINHITRK